MKIKSIFLISSFLSLIISLSAQPIIIDHACTNIYQIPIEAIQNAKTQLHIGYGFTSHGSQIITGMSGLVTFMNSKDGYPQDLFKWNDTGSNGALHLYRGSEYDEGDLELDAGYYPGWVEETHAFLGEPANGVGSNNPEINVIMWAWCGQLGWYTTDEVFNSYLHEMSRLEAEYPGITFVYMTGHSEGSGLEGTLHQNNQTIRSYCTTNKKVLYDFYDIECYDPDGHYFGDKYVSDDCSYDGGNWAQEWQNAHTEGVDWYQYEAAHTEPLNANQKAYAVWWLWARLGGWDGTQDSAVKPRTDRPSTFTLEQNYPNPFNSNTIIPFTLTEKRHVNITVFNLQGQRIKIVLNQTMNPGIHNLNLRMDDVPSGIYLYQLQVDQQSEMRRLLYLK